MDVSMGDLEELGAERNFLPGGVTFTGQRTWETGPGQRPLEHSTALTEELPSSSALAFVQGR